MGDSLVTIPPEKRWRNQEQPVPVVIAIIRRFEPGDASEERAEKYLLIKRKSGPYRHYWALVGGKWDFGEGLASVALREIKEETGLDGSFNSLKGLVNERVILDSSSDIEAAHFLIFVCQVDAETGDAQEKDEGAVDWFSSTEIEKLNAEGRIIPSDYAMLSQFVGEDPLPYVEVEMETLSANPGTTRMTRFEVQR